ncbi:hypothetical protein NTGBS_470035 [Candidatus Nitrotoga sp. BS]|uniref:hypothetical protein n=1 Tax=Candidatus Nitrotoga sp. BS TaxID=2890408 RepID=UPI001EF3535C|nr:hypothetical protein [Candidatus Nitrotoga sp. BS]CAH1202350.1 hypothetical protein NTGBS_470035 [Candidatus Nitrotoga sp. BS]
MTQVPFRFDDPSPHGHWQVEADSLAALERHGPNATVAVSPYSLMDRDMVALIADVLPHLKSAANAGFIEIAQYGYYRQRRGVTGKGGTSKFFGLLSNARQRMIKAGRARNIRSKLPWRFQDRLPPRLIIPAWRTVLAAL